MVLTIDDVEKIMQSKREIRKETYKAIYEGVTKKIVNSVNGGQRSVKINIPSFMIGYPLYNVNKATKYIARQLEVSGFNVDIRDCNTFKVSWNSRKPVKEKEKEKEDVGDLPSLVNLKKLAKKYNN